MANEKYLKPIGMVVIYEGDYAEYHDITKGVPGAAKPLSIEVLKNFKGIMENVSDLNYLEGKISTKLIYINSDPTNKLIIWQTPKMKRKLTFSESAGGFSGDVNVPRMLWKLKNDELYIYFIKDGVNIMKGKFISYVAGFPNVFHTGNVCFGNVSFEPSGDQSIDEIIKHTESCFFDSVFTDEVNVCDKDLLLGAWSDLMLGNPNEFPFELLPNKEIELEDLW